MNIIRRLFFLFLIFGLFIFIFASETEYTLKAVYLERFTRFVEWPKESKIENISRPFIIAVIDNNPFGSILKEIYSKQTIQNKKVEIREITNINEIPGCHILFISILNNKKLSQILAFTREKPILTVSDTPGFAEKGVHINFYIKANKVRFEINESAVRESGLYMSYLLLKFARIVGAKQ